MGWQQFTLTVVSSAAWPAVVLFGVLVIRREMRRR